VIPSITAGSVDLQKKSCHSSELTDKAVLFILSISQKQGLNHQNQKLNGGGMKYRSCPVCKNSDAEVLHNLKFKLLEGTDLPDNYDIVICDRCHFVYADTSATQEQYDAFYRDHSIYENGASISDKEKYKTIFECLRKRFDKSKSILEIGFANGELLKMLKKDGFKYIYGLDPSKACVDSLNNIGITAIQGTITNNSINKKFDAIILSHVMEHILDISSAMNSIKNLLAGGGTIYIETPDLEQYKSNTVTPFNYFDIEHINHFGKYSLVNLVEQNGFRATDFGSKKWSIGGDKFYPACWVMANFRRIAKSGKCRTLIKSYVEECVNKTYPEIEELIKTQEEIIVWGTGSFTQRLYMQTHLDKCNIRMFIDNNKSKWGREFGGKRILSPFDIKIDNKILIASVYGSQDIKAQVIKMGLRNEIIILSEK
jgi:SAM-dependent methyltransferase